MVRIVFDSQTIQIMGLFEQITHAELKDCIMSESQALFVVAPNEMGKAIGTGGRNIRSLEKGLKRRVKIVEFDPDIGTFIKNLFLPLRTNGVKQEGTIVTIVPADSQTRGLMIGRNATTLRSMEEIVKRYFDITELKVHKW